MLPKASRWRDALLAIADEEYPRAAAVLEQIGSHPLAANVHLLAARHGAPEHHAAAVIAFAEKSGATLYLEGATQLVAAG